MDRFIEYRFHQSIQDNHDLKSNMDRFIGRWLVCKFFKGFRFKIQYGQIYRNKEQRPYLHCRYLKSNMDRFIVQGVLQHFRLCKYLKSNMDRFIDFLNRPLKFVFLYLKSNMDRFIAGRTCDIIVVHQQFKIQYGQIYRKKLTDDTPDEDYI